MNFNQELEDIPKVHVLLIGVENLPDEKLQMYCDILATYSKISLESVNFTNEMRDLASNFSSTYSDGYVNYKFHIKNDIGASYPLHLFKNFLVVFGIGEHVSDIMSSYYFISKTAGSIPSCRLWRLLCFEPNEDDSKYEQEAKNLILFHPGLAHDRLCASVEIVLQDLTGMLIAEFGRLAEEMHVKECIYLPDENDFAKLKKKKNGRYIKLIGDLCLLLGSLIEANEEYVKALEAENKTSDWLWVAATYESIAATELMLSSGQYQNLEAILSKLGEAKFNYTKAKNPMLAIECQYRMAKLYINSGQKFKGIEIMTRVLDSEIDGVDQYDRVYVAKSLGDLCKSLGYHRKSGFFYKLAAHKCYDNMNYQDALKLMDEAAESYHIKKGEEGETATKLKADSSFNWTIHNQRENMKPWVRGQYQGWKNLQKLTLEYLKALSKKVSSSANKGSTVKYTWDLLAILHSSFTPELQTQLKLEIEQDAIHVPSEHLFRPLVQLTSLKPQKYSLEVNIENGDSPFLFNPFPDKGLNWITDCLNIVRAVMHNPLSFDVPLDHTRLLVEGAAECCPTSHTLPAHSTESFEYYIVPKTLGNLKIVGVHMQMLGLNCTIQVDPIEIEVMQRLPELKVQADQNKVVMLSSELRTINLSIKNISSEPLGNFKIYCEPSEVATFDTEQLETLKTLRSNSQAQLQVTLNAYKDSTNVKFSIRYSNSEGKIWLSDSVSLFMEVIAGVEILESRMEPLFEYSWWEDLHKVNPSMSEIGNSFGHRDKDRGINDHSFCKFIVKVVNRSKDDLEISALITNLSLVESQQVIIPPEQTHELSLLLERFENVTVIELNKRISIEWRSLGNNRRGKIDNLPYETPLFIYAEQPKVKFSAVHGNDGPFKNVWIKVTFEEDHKGDYLYLYPLKRLPDGNKKLLPQDLILIGSLAISLNEGEKECVHELKYLPLEKFGYCLVAAVGSKSCVRWWSHESWEL
ncbi:TRS120 [Blepharisma stoltei]|uniref:Trafficking protein particle complex subunit 11 n=1 Tax=Blepharisma stoltei TaxID=1481888 RepID=A0AAU9ID10_9CILI|nr:unnamed protein product [Blepharisma stoltei]